MAPDKKGQEYGVAALCNLVGAEPRVMLSVVRLPM